ncbi:MAG TPA: ATP-binding protein, partial [Leptospiraceae bacterium]|nr:ATP-binding protein [Leptospiraceae bacterium]
GYYIIGEDIVRELISSADSARERLEKWEECIHILGNVHVQENLPVRQIKDCVSDIIRNLESLKKVKNHTIETIFDSAEKEISLNLKAFQILIREGLLNALKFSSPDSKIVLFGKAEAERFSILIINEIILMEGGISGIPSEYEEYVFHPFFKLNNVYNEKYAVGEPGLGIGLFLIRHLTQEMSGSAGIKMLSSLASDNGKYLNRNTAALNISFPYIQA